MKSVSSSFGKVWIHQDPTPIDVLSVAETGAHTVQVTVGIRNFNGDFQASSSLEEIVIELDAVAAGELAEKLATAALSVAKKEALAEPANLT